MVYKYEIHKDAQIGKGQKVRMAYLLRKVESLLRAGVGQREIPAAQVPLGLLHHLQWREKKYE